MTSGLSRPAEGTQRRPNSMGASSMLHSPEGALGTPANHDRRPVFGQQPWSPPRPPGWPSNRRTRDREPGAAPAKESSRNHRWRQQIRERIGRKPRICQHSAFPDRQGEDGEPSRRPNQEDPVSSHNRACPDRLRRRHAGDGLPDIQAGPGPRHGGRLRGGTDAGDAGKGRPTSLMSHRAPRPSWTGKDRSYVGMTGRRTARTA